MINDTDIDINIQVDNKKEQIKRLNNNEAFKYLGITTSPDGNTVDGHQEHAAFMDNALRYQASLQLLDSRIKGIKNAIKGESS